MATTNPELEMTEVMAMHDPATMAVIAQQEMFMAEMSPLALGNFNGTGHGHGGRFC